MDVYGTNLFQKCANLKNPFSTFDITLLAIPDEDQKKKTFKLTFITFVWVWFDVSISLKRFCIK